MDTSPDDSLLIKDLVAGDTTCSNQLRRAIARNELPIATVAEYMFDANKSRCSFEKNVPGLGKKSIEELHELILETNHRLWGDDLHGLYGFDGPKSKHSRARALSIQLLEGIIFPDFVFKEDLSVRLANILVNALGKQSMPLAEFLALENEPARHLEREIRRRTGERKELDWILEKIIRNRLSDLEIDPSNAGIVMTACAFKNQAFRGVDDLLSYENFVPQSKNASVEVTESENLNKFLKYFREYNHHSIYMGEDSTNSQFHWKVKGFGKDHGSGTAPSPKEAYEAACALINEIQSNPYRFPINFLGFPEQDGGDVVTSDGEYLGTWRWSPNEQMEMVEFFPDGSDKPLFTNPIFGLLVHKVREWHEANQP